VRAALVVAALLVAAPAAAEEHVSKKDARWNEKQAAAAPPRKLDRKKLVGKPAAKVISLYNTWTHEWVAVDAKAKALPPELTDRLLRCHFTNEPTEMDNRLSGAVLAAARHFGASRVNIVSGYRAPKYNLMLRKKGRRVAKDSEHTRGHAVDFWMPGVSTEALYSWAMSHKLGGVGKYISDGFIHMDVGRRRTWVDK
jgi:uncharacterized protein YcbK (DUF882 family)